MFPRVLIDDGELYLAVDWLGFGQMSAIDKAAGLESHAPAAVKAFIVDTLHEMTLLGFVLDPSSAACREVLRGMASIVLDPSSLMSRATLSQQPRFLAVGLMEEFNA